MTNPPFSGTVAGAIGGLAGGLFASALLAAKQMMTGSRSDFVHMQRDMGRGAAWVQGTAGHDNDTLAYAAHLMLSAATGAAYGALKPAAFGPVTAGLALGAGLGAVHGAGHAAFGDSGVDLARRELRAGPDLVQHLVVNALFGLTTALVTDRLTRRRARRA